MPPPLRDPPVGAEPPPRLGPAEASRRTLLAARGGGGREGRGVVVERRVVGEKRMERGMERGGGREVWREKDGEVGVMR